MKSARISTTLAVFFLSFMTWIPGTDAQNATATGNSSGTNATLPNFSCTPNPDPSLLTAFGSAVNPSCLLAVDKSLTARNCTGSAANTPAQVCVCANMSQTTSGITTLQLTAANSGAINITNPVYMLYSVCTGLSSCDCSATGGGPNNGTKAGATSSGTITEASLLALLAAAVLPLFLGYFATCRQ